MDVGVPEKFGVVILEAFPLTHDRQDICQHGCDPTELTMRQD